MDKILWSIFRFLSFFKILLLKMLWVRIWLFSKCLFWWLPQIRYASKLVIWKNVQIGKSVRFIGMITLWDNIFINEYGSINAWPDEDSSIRIDNDVMFGPGVFLQAGDHSFRKGELYRLSENWRKWAIHIKNNVWIWARTIILKWVTIGENCVIGAWSVVTKDVPDNTVYAGNPAKFIKDII